MRAEIKTRIQVVVAEQETIFEQKRGCVQAPGLEHVPAGATKKGERGRTRDVGMEKGTRTEKEPRAAARNGRVGKEVVVSAGREKYKKTGKPEGKGK